MSEQYSNTNINFLVAGFTYPLALLNQMFYLRKRDLKVVGVHIFDYSLLCDDAKDYETGLSDEENKDIIEAIIANEKDDGTHIDIPRLGVEERFEMMEQFIEQTEQYRKELQDNLKILKTSITNFSNEFYPKGIKRGIDMKDFTRGIQDEQFTNKWIDFYFDKTKPIATAWLAKQVREE